MCEINEVAVHCSKYTKNIGKVKKMTLQFDAHEKRSRDDIEETLYFDDAQYIKQTVTFYSLVLAHVFAFLHKLLHPVRI